MTLVTLQEVDLLQVRQSRPVMKCLQYPPKQETLKVRTFLPMVEGMDNEFHLFSLETEQMGAP